MPKLAEVYWPPVAHLLLAEVADAIEMGDSISVTDKELDVTERWVFVLDVTDVSSFGSSSVTTARVVAFPAKCFGCRGNFDPRPVERFCCRV